jgi:hypothetical protein
METIKLTTHIDNSGTLRLELPTQQANRAVEVLVVLHPTTEQIAVGWGWPDNYFESIDAIESDDLVARPSQGDFEDRETLA